MTSVPSGFVATGFEAVADEFARQAALTNPRGSCLTVMVDGATVVDLVAGSADAQGRVPWGATTVAPMFSGTKGLVAVVMLRLIEAGLIDLDAPVSAYWPEYGAHGKESTLVRHVVSHLAGVPGIRVALSPDDLLHDHAMAQRIADEPPILAPGSALVYHPFTFGWVCGELVRRTDGRSIGRYVAEELARPLGMRTWIGVPEAVERDVAELTFDPPGAVDALGARAGDTLARVLLQNPVLEQSWWNSRAFRAAEIPGANGVTDSRSMAAFYADLVAPSPTIVSADSVDLGTTPIAAGLDALTGAFSVFGVGFQLANGTDYFGPVSDAFGHGGVGGGRHGGWRSARTAFSYLPGHVMDGARDRRAPSILTVLANVIGA